jgi:hypothetical protein
LPAEGALQFALEDLDADLVRFLKMADGGSVIRRRKFGRRRRGADRKTLR